MRVEAAAETTLEAMAADPSRLDGVRVAREFEAMLLAQVWKGALAPVGGSRLLDGGSAGRMYREQMVEEVVRRAALSRGFGLAAQVAEQLESAAEGRPAAAGEDRVGDRSGEDRVGDRSGEDRVGD